MQEEVELLANKGIHPQIIVATPGRLNALIHGKKLRLSGINVFVLVRELRHLMTIELSILRTPAKPPR